MNWLRASFLKFFIPDPADLFILLVDQIGKQYHSRKTKWLAELQQAVASSFLADTMSQKELNQIFIDMEDLAATLEMDKLIESFRKGLEK